MSASTASLSESASIMSAVNKKVRKIIKTYGFKNGVEKVQNEMTNYLLSLKDEDLIEVLSRRKTIHEYRHVLPLMSHLFIKCQSEAVCQWLTENTNYEDDHILSVYLRDVQPAEWKVQLTRNWLDGDGCEVSSEEDEEDEDDE